MMFKNIQNVYVMILQSVDWNLILVWALPQGNNLKAPMFNLSLEYSQACIAQTEDRVSQLLLEKGISLENILCIYVIGLCCLLFHPSPTASNETKYSRMN